MVAIFTGLGAGFTRGSGTLLGGAGQLGSSLLGRGGESVSVNAASGNLLVSHQDEFLVGLGPDVAIARTYNSLSDTADGDNGDQWQQSTTRRVFGLTGTLNSAGSTVSRLGADGSVVVYAWDAARSAYVTKDGAGAFDTLTCASDVWTWRDGDTQATETYAQYGAGNWRIAAAADADGNGLTFSYNADKLDKVTTSDGAWTQYAWSGNAITQVVTGYTDLATSTAKTLTRVRYGYDGQGRLQSVTTDLTPDDNAVSDANTYVVTYTYDGTSNRIASIAQTDGSLLQIAYDGSDRVQTLTQTVASGVTRVTTLAYGSGYTSVTGPDGQVTRLDYDGSGRLTKITAPPATSGATAQTVQFTYDADGNLDSVTDGAGTVTSYDYDASGNATLVTDPTGHTVTRSYDAQNRLITELTNGADRDGASVSHYSQYVYDAEGHLRFAVNAAGQVTEYRYTAAGQLARTIQYAENRMTPPGAAAISLATAEAWVAGVADKSSVRITENSYDTRGNVVRTVQYSDLYVNRVGNSAFDSTAGWLVGFNPNGIASGDPYPVTQNGKNAIKLNISATAADQQASLCTDGDHFMEVTPGERLFVQVGVELVGAAVSPVLAVQFRDADGNYLGAANIASGTGNQPYDTKLSGFLVVPEGVARVRLEVYAFTSGTGTGSFSIIEPMITPVSDGDAAPIYTVGEGGFDAGLTAGNSPAALSRAYYVYDQAGQLIESWREGETHETFLYDGMGRLYSSSDRNGGMTTIVFADAATTTTITSAAGFSSVSVYNKAGDLVSVTESGANTTAGTASYQYDASGRLRVVTDATGRKSYVYYDKAGRKVAEANHLGEVREYLYDGAGRVAATVAYATALSSLALTSMGNPASTADFATLRPSANAADVWGWTIYDDAGRAIQSIDNLGGTVRYEYDSEGKLAKTTAFYTRLTPAQLTAFRAAAPTTLQLPAAHAKDAVSRVFYNKAGQQIGTLDGEGFLSETIRDGAGLEIQTTYYATATNSADRASGSFATLRAAVVGASTVDRTAYSVYDGQGLLRFSVNARGGITGYSYDDAGRLVKTTVYATEVVLADFTYDAVKAAVVTNAADRTSWTVYDAAGRAAYTVDAEGGVAAFKYDTSGQVTKAVAYDNLYTSTITLAALDSWVANSAQANDTKNRVTRNWYNARGELIYSLDAENYVTGYAYDAEGRVLSTTRYGGSGIAASDTTTIAQLAALLAGTPTSTAITVSQTYDNAGRVLTSTDGEGIVTRNSYDALGQLIDVTEAYGTGDAATTHYTYDGAGRVLTQTSAYGANEAVTVTYAYDGLGNRSSVTDANGNTTSFTYDRLGQVLTSTNALNGVTAYVYDPFGNVVKVTDPKGGETYNYYDKLGRLVAALDAEGYLTRSFYNRFSEVVGTRSYLAALTDPAEIGVAVFSASEIPSDPYANATQLQEQATALDAQADAAEAAVPGAQATATTTAQAAEDADDLVADLEAQLAAAGGGGPVSFESARAAALANPNAWLTARASWLNAARTAINPLKETASGLGRTVLLTYSDMLRDEADGAAYLAGLWSSTSNLAKKETYINAYYNNLTWEASNLGSDRGDALANPLSWLTARKAGLVNIITDLLPITSINDIGDVRVKMAALWADSYEGIYDLNNNTYSTNWGDSTSLYNTVKTNPSYVPNSVNNTTQQSSTYRANIVINTYFDVLDAVGVEQGSTSNQALVNQLNQAIAAATAAHNTADAAAAAAIAAQATATQLRASATQAQAAADAAFAAILNGVVPNQDNFVLFDPSEIGASTTQWYYYDRLGRVVQKVDAEGYVETSIYDAFDQIVAFSRYSGKISSTFDSPPTVNVGSLGTDSTTAFEYDRRGALKKTTDAQGWYESYSFDAFGRQVSVTAKSNSNAKTAGGTTTYEYYKNGLLKSETLPIQAHNSAGNTTGAIKKSYVYDQRGNLRQQKEADGLAEQRVTTYTYDKLNRKLTTSSPAVSGLTINTVDNSVSSVSGSPVETITYDPNGNVIRIVDTAGAVTVFYYDALNRKTSEINALGTVTTYAYDANGNVERVRVYEHALNMVQSSTGKNFSLVPYDLEGWAAKVHRMYDIALGRLAVSTEVENWVYRAVNMYGNTATALESICSEILGDSGVQARLSPTNVTTFVTQMYQLGFGRNPTSAEVTTWVTALNNGSTTRGAMLAVFVDHQDHRARVDGTIAALKFGMANLDAIEPSKYRETTFTYDKLGRMLTSTVTLPSGYKTGVWNGSAWTNATTASLVTSYQYDYLGNVVKVADPGGNSVFSYYDKLARKTAQLDQEGYLSTWTYDSEGNVLTERRYFTRFTGTPGTSGPPSVSTNANDRVTTYTYDKVGNRLSEARSSVVVHNGTGGTSTDTSSISYVYNGLGQVVRKTEATGEQFDYSYDVGGRLTQETRPAFTSSTGASVTPQLNYFYNGLGNLSRTVQAGNADASARITTYAYDAGGRLSSMVDAEGKTRSYRYDQAGRLVLEYYSRTVMATDGSTSTSVEGIGYRYDAMGRNLGQGFYKSINSGVSWQFQTPTNGADATAIEYNAFGDVTKIKINEITQQENVYDLAGRLWKSTSGDGLWKYFGYDKNGNQTLTITSAGANISGKTLAQAFAMVGQSDVNGSYTVYDKRNMATSVVEEGRQLADDTTVTLTTGRTYTAFGEVASETDAAGATITYTYNTMGRRIRVESPTVSITMEDGTTRYVKPSEDFYYDASGRLVAMRDSNGTYATGGTAANGKSKGANTGNLTRLTLLAGTGYGGGEALVVRQTTADGGISETAYDILGNARKTRVLLSGDGSTPATDVWRTTEQAFDKLGRIIKATRPGASAGTYFYDSYAYDELGQLVEHGNSVMSTAPAGTTNYLDGNTEISTFDIQGRIVKSRAYGGDITETTYSWDASLEAAGTGLTDTGGWVKQTIYRNTLTTGVLTVIEKTDTYGRIITRTDLDGRLHNFSYNLAGWMTKTYNTIAGAAEINYSYYNTGQIRGQIGNAPETLYKYDEVGRRRYESVRSYNWQNGQWEYLKQATVIYDKLGRIAQFEDQGGPDIPYAKLVFGYDANGNVMSTASTYSPLDQYGDPGTQTTVTKYNLYDAGNRMVLADGELSGSAIVRGTGGKGIVYDKAGQRVAATITKTTYDAKYGYPVDQEVQEIYEYDAAGRLQNRKESLDGGTTVTLRSTFTYDGMGRVLTQKDFTVGSTTQTNFDKTVTYNDKGQVSFERTYTLVGADTIRADATYTYLDYDGNYALGQVGKIDTINYKNNNNSQAADTLLQYRYDLYEKATLSQSIYKPDKSQSTTYYNNYQIDSWGYTRQVDITDGRSRSVIIKHDENNQILSREEDELSYNRGNPRQIYYRFDGRQLGEISNDGTLNIDYQTSVERRSTVQPTSPGPFMNGSTAPTAYTDFNQHYDAINSYQQSSSTRSSYTVQGGESLQSIAASVWGDASLWYSIAEANGLSAGQQLTAGQTLVIPANVVRSHNNADTFKAYDPGKALGDISPTAASPAPAQAKKNKCGVLGMVLLAVVAIAVTVVTAGAAVAVASTTSFASGLSTVLGTAVLGGTVAAGGIAGAVGGLGAIAIGAGSAAIGSIVSQGVGVATGIQEKFSWKGVALAAIGGGVGGALAPGGILGDGGLFGATNSAGELVGGALGKVGSGVVRAGLSGITSSAVSQGIAIASGLQSSFSWSGLAAAGAAAATGAALGHSLASDKGFLGIKAGANSFGNLALSSSASLLANAATRSAIEGTSFGDNILAGLPDVIGQVLGRFLADEISGNGGTASTKPRRIIDANGDELILGESVTQEEMAVAQVMTDRMIADAANLPPPSMTGIVLAGGTDVPLLPGQQVVVSDVPLRGGPHDTLSIEEAQATARGLKFGNFCSDPGFSDPLYDGATGDWTTCEVILETQATSVANRLSALGITDATTMSKLSVLPGAAFLSESALLEFAAAETALAGRNPSRDPYSMSAKGGVAAGVALALGVAELSDDNQTLLCSDIGTWITDPNYGGYSLNAKTYQDFIGGRVGQNFRVSVLASVSSTLKVDFDGCFDTPFGPELREAKASYGSLLNPGNANWSRAPAAVAAQGQRQVGAVTELMASHPDSNISLNWYAQTEADQGYISTIFGRSAIPITVNHLPMPGVSVGR